MKMTKLFSISAVVILAVLATSPASAVHPQGYVSDEAASVILRGSSTLDKLAVEAEKACDTNKRISTDLVLQKIDEIEADMKVGAQLISNAMTANGHVEGCAPASQAQGLAYVIGIGNPLSVFLKTLINHWRANGYALDYPACNVSEIVKYAKNFSDYARDKANADQQGNFALNCNFGEYTKRK